MTAFAPNNRLQSSCIWAATLIRHWFERRLIRGSRSVNRCTNFSNNRLLRASSNNQQAGVFGDSPHYTYLCLQFCVWIQTNCCKSTRLAIGHFAPPGQTQISGVYQFLNCAGVALGLGWRQFDFHRLRFVNPQLIGATCLSGIVGLISSCCAWGA